MQKANLLIIMSDQHNPKVLGHAGHPVVKTPNLDRLAESGTRFTAAYAHSPLCVPARTAFATGRYAHDTGSWDNGSPYDGRIPSWGHRLMAQGHHVRSIGKLHYRSPHDSNGFSESENPMWVVEGRGDLLGCIRDESRLPLRPHARETILEAGPGDSSYTRYDDDITARTIRWLREEAGACDKPWALFCSMVCPHPPKLAPPDFYDLYPLEDIPWPVQATAAQGWTMHPAIAEFRRAFRWDEGFTEVQIRKSLAAYLGQISFLDHNIGRVLSALDEAGLRGSTRVVYTTDHGDNMGNHGLWNKNTLYEDAAGVPMILSGPDISPGQEVDTPVTHTDCFPTFIQAVGSAVEEADDVLPGSSLLELANGAQRRRPVLLSQFHGGGTLTGVFAVRRGAIKYIHHVDMPHQLFDLAADPDETNDLATDPRYAAELVACEAELRTVCDPETIDAQAHADQAEKIEAAGGKDVILARGVYAGSPVPGEPPNYAPLNN